MNLIDFNLLAEGGWDMGPNLLQFLMAVITFLTAGFAAYRAWRSEQENKETKLEAQASKLEARRARRVSVKAAKDVEEIKTAVAVLPEIKTDVNSNFTKQDDARKLSDEKLETANAKLQEMSKLLIDAKTEQAAADRDRAVVQKVNGAKPAEPPATIVNVEEMNVEADAVSIDQKEKKSG